MPGEKAVAIKNITINLLKLFNKFFFKLQIKIIFLISIIFLSSCEREKEIKEQTQDIIKEEVKLEKYDCGSNSSEIEIITFNENSIENNINIKFKNSEKLSDILQYNEKKISLFIEGIKVLIKRDNGEMIIKKDNLITIIQCKKQDILKKD